MLSFMCEHNTESYELTGFFQKNAKNAKSCEKNLEKVKCSSYICIRFEKRLAHATMTYAMRTKCERSRQQQGRKDQNFEYMIAELIIPIESLRGQLRKDGYYFRVCKGVQIVQRCPRKWTDTPARKAAREKFIAKYGKKKIAHTSRDA